MIVLGQSSFKIECNSPCLPPWWQQQQFLQIKCYCYILKWFLTKKNLFLNNFTKHSYNFLNLWLQSLKLHFRIYWPENFKIRIFINYIDSIENIWQNSLVRINFHWPWSTGPLLMSMTVTSAYFVAKILYLKQTYLKIM